MTLQWFNRKLWLTNFSNTLLGTNVSSPKGTFESMIFRASQCGIGCSSSMEGVLKPWALKGPLFSCKNWGARFAGFLLALGDHAGGDEILPILQSGVLFHKPWKKGIFGLKPSKRRLKLRHQRVLYHKPWKNDPGAWANQYLEPKWPKMTHILEELTSGNICVVRGWKYYSVIFRD